MSTLLPSGFFGDILPNSRVGCYQELHPCFMLFFCLTSFLSGLDFFQLRDWTDGCIAVTNEEIEEIFGMVPVGTRVEIQNLASEAA